MIYGGAVALKATAVIRGSAFVENEVVSTCGGSGLDGCNALAEAGALSLSEATRIENSLFFGNRVTARSTVFDPIIGDTGEGPSRATGAAMSADAVELENVVVACNRVESTGGFSEPQRSAGGIRANELAARNVTIVFNDEEGVVAETLDLSSSVVWGNTANVQIETGPGAGGIRYSTVEGGDTENGNQNAAPLFLASDCVAEDLQLDSASPTIDSGDPDPAFDDACFPPS